LNIYIINLEKDKERRVFQEDQFKKLGLSYEFIKAINVNDITTLYNVHKDDWQRPLLKVEVACYFSHQKLWKRIIEEKRPALILEDDALICKELSKILNFCSKLEGVDHISLESVGRKKLLGNKTISILSTKFKLSPLIIDRNGAGGYILYPSGAKKLLEQEKKLGIALADAQISGCFKLKSYQLESACIVQMDQCYKYGMTSPIKVKSNISQVKKKKITREKYFLFKKKRIVHQIKLAFRHFSYLYRAKRRKIKLEQNIK